MPEFKRSLAVVIGIDRYVNGIPELKTAVNDANELARILEEDYQYQVLRLLDEDATKDKLTSLLAAFEERTLPFPNSDSAAKPCLPCATLHESPKGDAKGERASAVATLGASGSNIHLEPDDRLLFYFAGHGFAQDGLDNADEPVGFVVPQDARRDEDTWLSMQRLHDALIQLPCRHLLIILDCCFAGTFRWAGREREVMRSQKVYRERYDRFIAGCAQQVITSTASDEKAADSIYRFGSRGEHEGHSPFAELLFQALKGEADLTKDEVITATELYVYLRDKITAKQTPELCQLKRHDKGEYIFPLSGFDRNQLEEAPALDEKTNPYKGLASFEQEDSDKFFGRTALTQTLQEFVTRHPLTVVLGASGTGKSSLVKAGLIPQLKNQQGWHILTPIRPGEFPFTALNKTLFKENLPVVARKAPEPGVNTLLARLTQWSQDNPSSKLLLMIDQCEELVTLCRSDTEREKFLLGLAEAIATCPEQFRLVLTLRNDFEAQLSDTALKPYWTSARFLVPAMTREELRDAIVEPAAAKVMYFEPPTLVDELIDEVMQMPGALPLLSFTLSELYFKYIDSVRQGTRSDSEALLRSPLAFPKGSADRAITQADYNELGGVTRSLTQRADFEYYELVKLDPAYEQIIKNVMLRMVAVDGGELARRKVLLSELEYPPGKNERVQEVIRKFTDARLLVKGQDSEGNCYVEPAHDALVRGWQKLLVWKQREQGCLILQRRLTPAAMEWNSNQPPTFYWSANPRDWWKQFWDRQQQAKFLWHTNPRLDLLKQVLDSTDNWFNQIEAEFVRRSLQRQRNNRSRTVGLVTAGFAIVLGFAGFQWYQSQVDQIKTLTASSKEHFVSDQQLDALIDALKAGKKLKWVIGLKSETRLQALTALQQAVYWVRERDRLEGYNKVGSIAWSPDGKRLAFKSGKTIKLWNPDGKELKSLEHSSVVSSIAWSPDGKRLASGSTDRTIKLWNPDGKELKSLEYSSAVRNIAWSPDGKLLALESADRTIKLWNPDGKELKSLKHSSAVRSVAWSPDSKRLALGSADGNIELCNQDGKKFKTLSYNPRVRIHSIAWSPDGKMLLASLSEERTISDTTISYPTIKLWNKNGELLHTLTGHDIDIESVSFSPNSKMLASGSYDKTVILWSTVDGKKLKTLQGHSDSVRSVVWSPDGKMLASASIDRTVKLWNPVNGKELRTIKNSSWVQSAAWNPDGKTLAWGSIDGTITLWRLEGEELKTLAGHTDVVRSVNFSPDGKMLASGSDDKSVNLWNPLDGKKLRTINRYKGKVYSVAWSPDSKILASGSEDKTVKLWNPLDGKELWQYPENDSVRSVSFSPDGKLRAWTSDDGTIKLWSKDGNKLRTLKDHKGEIWSVSFSPDSKMLASSGSGDGIIKLWNLTNGKVQMLDGKHSDRVRSIAWSPNGKLLASGSEDGTIKLWSLENRKERWTTDDVEDGYVYSVGFRPDGKLLASGSDSGTVKVWNLEGKEVMRLTGHSSAVRSVAWSHDGKWLASGGNDKTVLLWNLELLDLDRALERGCEWVHDYLKNNRKLSKEDRHLCDRPSLH